MRTWCVVVVLCAACGCSHYAYTNRRIEPQSTADPRLVRASLEVPRSRGNPRVLVLLAISGGGSRAAYFAGSAMLALEKAYPDINLLHEVDAITAVSGGCLPAAYYCVSEDAGVRGRGERSIAELAAELASKVKLAQQMDKKPAPAAPARAKQARPQTPAPSKRVWDEATVKQLMAEDYISSWGWKMISPRVWFLFLFTAYDRSDMMAEVLGDKLLDFGLTRLGLNLEFRHLNPSRPYLILNATNATADAAEEATFGRLFTFTDEHFRHYLASDVQRYQVSRAVMASTAFPGVFNSMTLRDFRAQPKSGTPSVQYMHVFDGGASDNLGLETVKQIILRHHKRYRNIIVISLDAHKFPRGLPRDDYDTRKFFDYAVDSNLADTLEALMATNRRKTLDAFRLRVFHDETLPAPLDMKDKMLFYHVSFDKVKDAAIRRKLHNIPTNLKLAKKDAALIDQAMPDLLCAGDPILRAIRLVLYNEGPTAPSLRGFESPPKPPGP